MSMSSNSRKAAGRANIPGIIVDNFAGGGGASAGIERGTGRCIDYAINHDAIAVGVHKANHPDTIHLTQDIWAVDPAELCAGRPVDFAWFSPDCRHFSKAKGGKPVSNSVRDLANVVHRWSGLPDRQKPKVIVLENVEEFRNWGPLCPGTHKPIKERMGEDFLRWVGVLKSDGYEVQIRELRACDYGAPTIRNRLFIIARCDGKPIVWPAPTHGKPGSLEVASGMLKPYRTAAEIIDWSLPCPSIFMDKEEALAWFEQTGQRIKRPLAEATMRRVARGVQRFVLDEPEPFIVGVGGRMGQSAPRGGQTVDVPAATVMGNGGGKSALVAPTLIQTGYGEREGQAPRAPGLGKPLGTAVAGGVKHALVAAHVTRFNQNGTGQHPDVPLDTAIAGATRFGIVAAFMAQHNGGMTGHDARKSLSTITGRGTQQQVVAAHLINQKGSTQRMSAADGPCPTITANGNHVGLVSAFLDKYYGTGGGADLHNPVPTCTVKERFSLVTVEIEGHTYAIADIGMRMLTPRELAGAQGFAPDYILDRQYDGTKVTKTQQVCLIGNSVCPDLAEAISRANFPGEVPARRERRAA